MNSTSRPFYLGIDLGTSYFKAGLFDESLRLAGLGRVPVPNSGDGTATSEVRAEDFWQAVGGAIKGALAEANAEASDIAALSWSSQANSFLLLDAENKPLTPLVLWNDIRTGAIPLPVKRLGDRADFAAVTGAGGPTSEYHAVAKIDWFRTERPDIWSRTARIATIADYLALGLSGEHKVDAATAAMLGILDLRALSWWPQGLGELGLSTSLFATPVRSGTIIGTISADGATRVSLPGLEGAKVIAGTLDHIAAALGAGLGEVASVSESTGTVLACVRNTDRFEPTVGITTLPGIENGTYSLLTYDPNGAGILEWYHNQFAPTTSFAELDKLAAAVPPDCDGLVMGDMPQLREGLSGFTGATDVTGHGHYARAIMSAVSDRLGVLLANLHVAKSERIVATGGGARSPFWLQLKRDRLGIDIIPASCTEPACRGAARLASL